ncbi:RNase H-like domain-containing protein, partial [Streptococcus pneumoniae]
RKNQKFEWGDAHVKAMRKLKECLQSLLTLRKVNYACGRLVIVTVDTSPTGIGWAIGQYDEEDHRYVVRFGAKVLSTRQRNYPQ